MSRLWIKLVLCGLLMSLFSCSKQEPVEADAEERASIKPLESGAVADPVVAERPVEVVAEVPLDDTPADIPRVAEEDFSGFLDRLSRMKNAERAAGETLLTGKRLVFNYEERVVQLDENVRVVDDQGMLAADSLQGRFTVSNEVDYVEAKGHVVIRSDGLEAHAGNAVYEFANGRIRLDDQATVTAGANRLSGERIQLWIKGSRKMICEPNAVLEISSAGGLALNGTASGGELTEIRADQVVYDEDGRVVDLLGHVRIRDPRVAMNSEKVQLHLKDSNEIDWIEALSEVIIQIDDRKALADRAAYYADEKKFELEGNPKVKQGKNIMTGDRITFWQETRRMVCEPNARVLLFVDDATKAKFLKDLNN